MAEPLKELINDEAVAFLGGLLAAQFTDFDIARFQHQAALKVPALSLTQRVACLADLIAEQLPDDFTMVSPQLHILAENWPVNDSAQGWQNYIAWPVISYAGQAGITKPELALPLLAALTGLFTAEFAIRPYLQQHYHLTYQHMLNWTQHADPHRRRLASEGLRPRLPWGKRLTNIPLPEALSLLEQLRDDNSVYVQKSVANHLNDLSKEHPDAILSLCKRWQTDATTARRWIIRRALRSLQKQADPVALALLGYQQNVPVNIDFQLLSDDCKLGEAVTLQLNMLNCGKQAQSLLIDYELVLPRAGGVQSSKVFFWQRLQLAVQQQVSMQKQQAMQQLSTRKLYPGLHEIRLRVNGQILASRSFLLRP